MCNDRLEYFRNSPATKSDLLPRPTIYPAADLSASSISNLPFRVVYNQNITSPSTLVHAGQVGCAFSHFSVWKQALAENATRVLILEDDVALTPFAIDNLPDLLQSADDGGLWHWIYLRRITVSSLQHGAQNHGQLLRAPPSWGTTAYILSAEGLRFMISELDRYEQPLDVAIAHLQRTSETFVALDGCASGSDHQRNCAEMVYEIPYSARGECSHSGTQSGWTARIDQFPCARR